MRLLRSIAQMLAAPIILFEEWGWEPLQRLIGQLARLRVIAWLERRIAALPPYGALAFYAVPSLTLIPVKILALALLAGGHALLGVVVLVSAKVLGTAVLARLFYLTKAQLLRIGWFARLYARWVPWKDAIIARVHGTAVWRAMHALGAEVRRTLGGWLAHVRKR